MRLDLKDLNPQQTEAVEHTQGPLLILAGAGSGKTKVLTYRIAYILQQQLAGPEQILAVTFTNKAAGEMKHRIAQLLGSSVPLPWMGTFHSICVRILKRDGHYVGIGSNFTIYDPSDQLDLVKDAMEKLNVSIKDFNPRAVHSHISSAKNELVSASDYSSYASGYFQEVVAQVYPVYQQLLKENNAVDFDDLLMLTVRLLQENREVQEKYQHLFRYILVDEYQDTNHAQYILVNLLAKKHQNICCVGDDDQSIYAFRGANIRNILNFHRDYPTAHIVKLEQNYRSTQKILDAAHAVVSKNKQRTPKKLWTSNPAGEQLEVFTAENERGEADWVVSQAKQLIAAGVNPEEIAVLYRTNAQSRNIEEACVRLGLPYRIVGGVRFYERKEIKDVLAYLRVLYNPADDVSLKRIINVPKRSIGPKAVAELGQVAKSAGISITQYLIANEFVSESKAVGQFAKLLSELMNQVEKLNIVELIDYLLTHTKYIESLQDGSAENEMRIENIKELISVAAKYEQAGPKEGLMLFLEEVSLLEEEVKDAEGGAVTMMTIHAAKGLEYEYVFLVGMEEGLFPHSRVFTDPSELEEERRLAYVAITRAKKRLYMLHADSRVYFGSRQNNMVSRFVNDIPEHLRSSSTRVHRGGWEDVADEFDTWQKSGQPELSVGDKIKHEYFGIGTVVGINSEMVKINFGKVYGTKELSLEFAQLEKI